MSQKNLVSGDAVLFLRYASGVMMLKYIFFLIWSLGHKSLFKFSNWPIKEKNITRNWSHDLKTV